LKVMGDLMFGISSGMTIKFFPLWLKDLGLSVVYLDVTYGLQYLLIGCAGLALQVLSARIGRIQTALWAKLGGLACFAAILVGRHLYWSNVALMASLHVARSVLMNAPAGLADAVLNDFVPKSSRARWNAVTTATAFGWSASAVFGGFVLSFLDYEYLFAITFTMQCVSLIPFVMLLWLVPKEEIRVDSAADSSSLELATDEDDEE
jgi:MFS family permease